MSDLTDKMSTALQDLVDLLADCTGLPVGEIEGALLNAQIGPGLTVEHVMWEDDK